MIILDTNVVTELMRPSPEPGVLAWLAAQPSAELFTTTICEAEILFGIARLDPGRRRAALQAAAEAMFEVDFAGRVLPFDRAAAHEFGTLAAGRQREGRLAGALDIQIAAIAAGYGATVATRNVDQFEGFGPSVINPWAPA